MTSSELDLDAMSRNGKFPVGVTDHADYAKDKEPPFPFLHPRVPFLLPKCHVVGSTVLA